MNGLTSAPRRRVLIAWDGSSAAATALPYGRAAAARLAADLDVVYCERAGDGQGGPPLTHLQLEGEAPVPVRTRWGEPTATILAEASAPDVALLVLTTHGRTVQRGRLLSDVSAAVLASAERPVLLVRPEAAVSPLGQSRLALRRVLIPLDGTPGTAAALEPFATLACRLGATIDLLYVAPADMPGPAERGSIGAPRYVDQPQHEWPQWGEELADRLCSCLKSASTEVRLRTFLAQGEVAAEIVRFATTHDTDLIALIRRSRLEPGRASVLRAVLDETPCPVLLLAAPVDV